eukprot:7208099-Pyramimonas_sp.AAC.1
MAVLLARDKLVRWHYARLALDDRRAEVRRRRHEAEAVAMSERWEAGRVGAGAALIASGPLTDPKEDPEWQWVRGVVQALEEAQSVERQVADESASRELSAERQVADESASQELSVERQAANESVPQELSVERQAANES